MHVRKPGGPWSSTQSPTLVDIGHSSKLSEEAILIARVELMAYMLLFILQNDLAHATRGIGNAPSGLQQAHRTEQSCMQVGSSRRTVSYLPSQTYHEYKLYLTLSRTLITASACQSLAIPIA